MGCCASSETTAVKANSYQEPTRTPDTGAQYNGHQRHGQHQQQQPQQPQQPQRPPRGAAHKETEHLFPELVSTRIDHNEVLLTRKISAGADFGLARNRTYEETLTAGVGTVRWTAPEVMLGENYSEQADVYSFGVVLSELDTRQIPFEEKSSTNGAPDMAIVIKVAKGELRPTFSPDCPEPIDRIAKACLQFDPSLRPTAASVVRMLMAAKAQL
ncbi:hypothetical protein P43SY_001317 [Pythium insidiosum]|uniref:Protein kinase domain-containing protein n=1 Tax=Pythium insidiosum TaxID=114742 RepID=A0AAD5LK22_PYTIN|nr:hypothetical protein P43SY_001317 [Pythium insidiosum]